MEGCVELSVCRYVGVGACSQQNVDDLNPAMMGCISQHGVALLILHVDEKHIVMAEVLDHGRLVLFNRLVELCLVDLVHPLPCHGGRCLLSHIFERIHGIDFFELQAVAYLARDVPEQFLAMEVAIAWLIRWLERMQQDKHVVVGLDVS